MYLSDNVKERVDMLDVRFGFISWFDGGIFSHEVGVRKPNPKIYEFALQKGGTKPDETVFIDDKPKMIEPATKMGITGLVFETPEKLEKDLIEIGVIKNDK
jgi:FMN phosphatase YigB (HAD superfamily)